MQMINGKPRYIDNGYGIEKLCIHCDEYYLQEDNFYLRSPSQQWGKTLRYESICIPCYGYRKSQYRLKKKQQLSKEAQ